MPTKPPFPVEIEVELNNFLDSLYEAGYQVHGLKLAFASAPSNSKIRKCTYSSDYGAVTIEVEK